MFTNPFTLVNNVVLRENIQMIIYIHEAFVFKYIQINIRDQRRGNQKRTIKSHRQHRANMTQDEDKQSTNTQRKD